MIVLKENQQFAKEIQRLTNENVALKVSSTYFYFLCIANFVKLILINTILVDVKKVFILNLHPFFLPY